jgi:hypothetical protein
MEANGLLEESLAKFDEKFVVLISKFPKELRPLGDAIESIERRPEPFVEDLLRFCDGIVTARKNPDLKDLPLPPYDLWLPFKAEYVPEWDAKALDDANGIFRARIVAFAKYWRLAVPAPRPPDPELVRLRDEIESLMESCNRRCSALPLIKSPLFEPSQTLCNDLFLRLIPTYVASEADFDRLVSNLYMAFDERLRKDVRQRKPERPLPAPLPRVAEVLHEGPFRHLGTLRNKTTGHDHREEAFEVAPIYRQLINKSAIDRDDVTSWQQLQKALLEMLVRVLKDVRQCFEQTPDDASNSTGGGRR